MGADSRGSSSRSSAIRAGSVIPKTARMITSIVIRCATVRVRILSPSLHVSISRFGDLLDQLRVARDRLAVERRQHQLAHAHVVPAVEQQDRGRAGHRLHHLARLAHVVLGGLPLEHLLDQVALGDVERLARDRVVGPEDAPVSPLHREPGLDRPKHPEQGLRQPGEARARDGGRRCHVVTVTRRAVRG